MFLFIDDMSDSEIYDLWIDQFFLNYDQIPNVNWAVATLFIAHKAIACHRYLAQLEPSAYKQIEDQE